MMVAEMWVDHIARTLGRPPEAIRELNFYREGDTTHFGQVLEGCQARRRPPSCPKTLQLRRRVSRPARIPEREARTAVPAADGMRRAAVEPAVGPLERRCGLARTAVYSRLIALPLGPCSKGAQRTAWPWARRSGSLSRARRALQVQRVWDLALRSAGGLATRRAAADAFNAGSRFRKRGLAAVPTKFGISFTTKFLNQARPCAAAQGWP